MSPVRRHAIGKSGWALRSTAAVPPQTDAGYEQDFDACTQAQAAARRALGRAGTNTPVDWENVAEEIESLGKSQGRELASRIETILLHLIKLQA